MTTVHYEVDTTEGLEMTIPPIADQEVIETEGLIILRAAIIQEVTTLATIAK